MRERQSNIYGTQLHECIVCKKDIRTLGGGVWQGQAGSGFVCWPCSGRTPAQAAKT